MATCTILTMIGVLCLAAAQDTGKYGIPFMALLHVWFYTLQISASIDMISNQDHW